MSQRPAWVKGAECVDVGITATAVVVPFLLVLVVMLALLLRLLLSLVLALAATELLWVAVVQEPTHGTSGKTMRGAEKEHFDSSLLSYFQQPSFTNLC